MVKEEKYEIPVDKQLLYTINTGKEIIDNTPLESVITYEALRVVVYHVDGTIKFIENNNGPNWKSKRQATMCCNEIIENIVKYNWYYGINQTNFLTCKVEKVLVTEKIIR